MLSKERPLFLCLDFPFVKKYRAFERRKRYVPERANPFIPFTYQNRKRALRMAAIPETFVLESVLELADLIIA